MEASAASQSYYDLLNVAPSCSLPDIRRAYRTLAMQWHPDKWANTPDFLGEAKLKFQNIQEAYSVLSDPTKRMLYDAGMYHPTDDQIDEGFCDFMQEMWSLMSQVKHQEVGCSMEDLQATLSDLLQGFDDPLPQSQSQSQSQWSATPWACSANLQKQPVTNQRPSQV